MKKFWEFIEDKNILDIKTIILDILDPNGDILNQEDAGLMTHTLDEFKNRNKLLTDPALLDIIDSSESRESVYTAINNPSTTIGNLIAMLNKDK